MNEFLRQMTWAFNNSVSERLKLFRKEKRKIAVIGMHSYGVSVAKQLLQQGLAVTCFSDMGEKVNGGGETFSSLPVYSIEKIVRENMACILCSGYDAEGKLEKIFADKKMEYLSFQYIDQNRYGSHHEITPVYSELDRCYQAYAKLDDSLSKHTYLQLLKYRLTRDPMLLEVSDYPQYFHPLVRAQRDDTVIEAGGCDGKTAIEIVDFLKGHGQVYTFEPDQTNYQKMMENLQADQYGNCVKPVQKGLWQEKTTLHFQGDFGGSSKVDQTGSKSIDVVDIDSFVKEHELWVNLIKLDVEGSEKEVLEGACKTIALYQPKLQISVYHYERDLWELLLYIHKLNPFYKFYLGQHTRSITETTLYAQI